MSTPPVNSCNSSAGLIEKYINSAYDNVKAVADNLGYLDQIYQFLLQYGLITNIAIKAPVQAVATSPITLSGNQVLTWSAHSGDYSVLATTGMRVLVLGQTNPVENGIYDVKNNAWTRSVDFDGPKDVVDGTLVFSSQGDVWQVDGPQYSLIPGTDPIIFKDIDLFAYEALREATEKAQEAAASAAAALASEQAAKVSEDNAASSETHASNSAAAAANSEINAKVSENAAKVSENNAKASQIAAQNSASLAESVTNNALTFATTAAGIAGTTNGQYFRVPQGSGATLSFIYYLNSSGTAQVVAEMPGKGAITNNIRSYSSVAVAQADITAGNILNGAYCYVRNDTDEALIDEYINNGGTLEATGRQIPSQKTVDTKIDALRKQKLDKYNTPFEDENLIVIADSEGNMTWLQASLEDGMPTAQAEYAIKEVTGRSDHSRIEVNTEELLFSLPDENGNLTALTVRKSDGMFIDAVIKDIEDRLNIPIPETDVDPNFKTYDRPSDFQILSSVARGLARHAAGTALPAKSYTFVNSYGQGNIIKLPQNYSDATPIPLVLILDGVSGDSTGSALPPSIRNAYDVLLENGIAMAKSRYHGDSYGSPKCMADLLELYQKACEIAPIGAVILYGNSMGGIAAQNCLLTNTIPNVSGLYLVDPTYDLYQRYSNGRASEINAAYECTSETYAEKTKGYDPALRHWSEYRGLPIYIRASSLDTSVVLSLHGQKLKTYLGAHNDVTLFDTQTPGHNTADRFNGEELISFIQTKCTSGKVIL